MDQSLTRSWVTLQGSVEFPVTQSHIGRTGPMRKILLFVGLDVHKDSIYLAWCRPGSGQPHDGGRGPNDFAWLLKRLRALAKDGATLKVCYEAGPTGFELARKLR